jgi:hypothetical protein
MVQNFHKLLPAFRGDFMDMLGLQVRPPAVPKSGDIPASELRNLLSDGPVNHHEVLKIRLKSMKEERLKAGLVGYPFPPNGTGWFLVPDGFMQLLIPCKIPKQFTDLVEALSDSFLIWMCVLCVSEHFPHDGKSKKMPAPARLYSALQCIDGLWKIYMAMGESVVLSGAHFDVDTRTFRCFEDTRLFALASAEHQEAHAASLRAFVRAGAPVSVAHRFAYLEFLRHPDLPRWGQLRMRDPAFIDWLDCNHEDNPVRKILHKAYAAGGHEVQRAIPFSTATRQIMGYGSDTELPP